MTGKAYAFPTAFSVWGEQERAAIVRVVLSNQFTMGGEVAAFEAEFAAYHGRQFGIMVNSGSSANLVAVAALFHRKRLPLLRGDVAFVPALAWSTTYAPLVQYGLQLRLLDCDGTWNAPESVVATSRPARLIVGCSILGNPGYMRAWREFADSIGAMFIEDNCESLGARIDGQLCGSFGHLSTFSFFHSHQISAIEGGMILTDDPGLYWLCRMLRAHGWSRDVVVPASQRFADEYDFRVMGYNVRPLELHAAIARAQLAKLATAREARLGNLAKFTTAITTAFPQVTFPTVLPTSECSPFGIAFSVPADRRERLAAVLREQGIDCRLPTGGSFHRHVYGADWRQQETPNADRIHDEGMFIGNPPHKIEPKWFDIIHAAFAKVFA